MSAHSQAWPAKVTLCEVGLRDGLQNEKTIPSIEQKLQLLDAVVASGVKIIEVGAFVHPKAVPQMADTDALCRAMKKVEGVEYRALVPNIKGVQRAFDAGLTKAKLTVSASEAHCLANFNSTPVKHGRRLCRLRRVCRPEQDDAFRRDLDLVRLSLPGPRSGRAGRERRAQLRQAGNHRTVVVRYHRHGQSAPGS
jgi:hypothetical protein